MNNAVNIAENAFKEQIDASVAAFFSSCVHCGLCAEACLFYTETGDPQYTPIHKLHLMQRVWHNEFTLIGKLKGWAGLNKKLTEQELTAWEPLIYDSCTLCGRCSLVCPVGNDISAMVRKSREAMVASGHAPQGLADSMRRSIEIGSPMGLQFPALQAQIRHVEAETGLTVPVDVENADYLALLSSMEIINFPEYIAALTQIFHQAGVRWTLSSQCFEATNAGIQIGSSDLAATLIERIVTAATALKVKTVISPECGHAYTALRWEGPNLIHRAYPFQVVHILELLEQLHQAGKLKTTGKDPARLTFHDPCQLVRKGGVLEQPRQLLNLVADNFVEMPDSGRMNWCCGGGGGVSANHRAEPLRLKVFARKQAQLNELGVEKLVTACANCRIMLEEGLDAYHQELPVLGLTELLASYLTPNPASVSPASTSVSEGKNHE